MCETVRGHESRRFVRITHTAENRDNQENDIGQDLGVHDLGHLVNGLHSALAPNDIGRVAEIGSNTVNDQMHSGHSDDTADNSQALGGCVANNGEW